MPIITIIVVIALVGLLLWAVNKYIPMEQTIKNILNIVVIILLVLWLLNIFGLLESLRVLHT